MLGGFTGANASWTPWACASASRPSSGSVSRVSERAGFQLCLDKVEPARRLHPVVERARERQVLDGGSAALGEGHPVMELEAGGRAAARPAWRDVGAASAVPIPHRPSHGRRDVAWATTVLLPPFSLATPGAAGTARSRGPHGPGFPRRTGCRGLPRGVGRAGLWACFGPYTASCGAIEASTARSGAARVSAARAATSPPGGPLWASRTAKTGGAPRSLSSTFLRSFDRLTRGRRHNSACTCRVTPCARRVAGRPGAAMVGAFADTN